MERLRIIVVRGAPQSSPDSFETGKKIHQLLGDRHTILDVIIDGPTWLHGGIPRDPLAFVHNSDVVFNAFHGHADSELHIHDILDRSGVPYTGPGRVARASVLNKRITKAMYTNAGLKTPIWKIVPMSMDRALASKKIFTTFPMPCVIKPVRQNTSTGVFVCHSIDEITTALEYVFTIDREALIEEYIDGHDMTCAVIDEFRDQKFYTTPPAKIHRVTGSKVLSSEIKSAEYFDGEVPAYSIDQKLRAEVERMTRVAHEILGMRHHSSSDFRVSPKRGVYILETNIIPPIVDESLFNKSLQSVGTTTDEVIEHIILLAMKKK